ncbi:MAG: hypothetical protein AAB511_03215 [Patescibacteria group bacterium]
MDTKFQTSFIPKKAINQEITRSRSESVSIFLLISVILFILSLAVAGGVFAYKKVLIGRIDKMNITLSQAKNSFEPDSIRKWNRLSHRIESTDKILNSHTIVSPVFDLLENATLSTVKFETFSYELKDTGSATLLMTGKADSFDSIALQSDIFGQEKYIKNPVFSDLNPDQRGAKVFKFNSSLDPTLISYKNNMRSVDVVAN